MVQLPKGSVYNRAVCVEYYIPQCNLLNLTFYSCVINNLDVDTSFEQTAKVKDKNVKR